MTITFENDNHVIIYALEKIISYARRTQQVFVAQCVWWLASIIGLEPGLVNRIDNLNGRTVDTANPLPNPDHIPERRNASGKENPVPEEVETPRGVSSTLRDLEEDKQADTILKEYKEHFRESRRLQGIAALKTAGGTLTGLNDRTPISKKHLRRENRVNRKRPNSKLGLSKIEGIDKAEIQRRKKEGECLRCAWPSDRKGSHRVADCRRPIKLDKGTALGSKNRKYQKSEQQHPTVEEVITEETSSTESSDDSL